MAIWSLPATRPDGRLPNPSDAGWVRVENFPDLPQSLSVDDHGTELDNVRSLPDPLARIHLINTAVGDDRHPNHAEALARWRGLLALIALRSMHASLYGLEVRRLVFDGQSALTTVLGKLAGRGRAGVSGFSGACILMLRPRGLNPVPAGLLYEECLVASGCTASSLRVPGLDWLQNGLSDPTASGLISPEEAAILETTLRSWAQTRRQDFRLAQLLGAYADAAASFSGGAAPLAPATNGLSLPDSPALSCLNTSWTVDESSVGTDTDCRLDFRSELEGSCQGVILADLELAKTFGRPASAIRLFGRHRLNAYAGNSDQIRREAAEAGWLIITPDDLFLDRLRAIDPEVGKAVGHPNGAEGLLLPLSPLAILLHPSAEAAHGSVSVEGWGTGYRVDLKFQLQAEDQTFTHLISRKYDSVETVSPPEDLSIWPDFEAADWPFDVLRFEGNPKKLAMPRFGVSMNLVQAHIKDRESAGVRAAEALGHWGARAGRQLDDELAPGGLGVLQPNNREQPVMVRLKPKVTATNVAEQQVIIGSLEALAMATSDGQPAGILLVARARLPVGAAGAVAAIDFGTSNSIVEARVAGTLKRIDFPNRVHWPIVPRAREARSTNLAPSHLDFFPLERHPSPLPTLGLRRDRAGTLDPALIRAFEADEEHYGLNFNIYFPPRTTRSDFESIRLMIRGNRLLTELKWKSGSGGRQNIKLFFRQIMMMTAAELRCEGVAVDKIQWRISFPRAFDTPNENQFKTQVRGAAKIAGLGGDIDFSTESRAAFHYFLHDSNRAMLGQAPLAIMLDIGGGTTDLAIWTGNEPLWMGSVRLAGGHFFRDVLAARPKIIDGLKLDGVSLAGMGNDSDARRAFADLVIATPRFAESFAKAWAANAPEPDWALLRRLTTLTTACLFHYLGLVLGRLVSEGKLSLGDVARATVVFGGRGSTFLKLLHGEGRLTPISGLIGAASGLSIDASDLRFSAETKEEVARGLLYLELGRNQSEANTIREDKADTMPLGLELNLRGAHFNGPVAASDTLESLARADRVAHVETADLTSLFDELARFNGGRVTLNDPVRIDNLVRPKIDRALQRLRDPRDEEEASGPDPGGPTDLPPILEPPLIMAVREILALAATGQTKDDGRTPVVSLRD